MSFDFFEFTIYIIPFQAVAYGTLFTLNDQINENASPTRYSLCNNSSWSNAMGRRDIHY